ncbi:hypothetical protein E2C01_031339 [Portunus trituberculatus]|uniref:Uncharacterized protein n=1 Tax=Portunus trituberculatus TaxID=210409 RepID=A0A5B7EZT7_PORTR|nr:hypothetical protein [Portunus trituberculatus]
MTKKGARKQHKEKEQKQSHSALLRAREEEAEEEEQEEGGAALVRCFRKIRLGQLAVALHTKVVGLPRPSALAAVRPHQREQETDAYNVAKSDRHKKLNREI